MTRTTWLIGAAAVAGWVGSAGPVCAQATGTQTTGTATTGLTAKHFVAWGEIGFQGDIGGDLNTSGIGRLGGTTAEMDANSWGERYDAALVIRVGAGYNLSDTSQVIFTTHWEQAEADPADVGLVGLQPLQATFTDYQGWGLDVGYRRYVPTVSRVKPFAEVAVGFERVESISADLVAQPNFIANAVPFYDDSWVILWRIGGGVTSAFTERLGLQISAALQYAGELSDKSGLGALGFERINNAGNKWAVPVTAGVYWKF
jgi:hypothetical protein